MIELIALLLIAIAIAVLAWWRALTHPEKGRDAAFESVFLMLSTFLGVFAALYFSSCQAKRDTINGLSTMASAARAEAEANLTVISTLGAEPSELSDSERLILESPARGLAALVEYPPFLEYAAPERARELLSVSTSLNWHITFRNDPSGAIAWPGGPKTVTARAEAVAENLSRAIDLLDAQIADWE